MNDRIESDHVPVELLRGEGNSDTIKIEDKAVKRGKKRYLKRLDKFHENLLPHAYWQRMNEAQNLIEDSPAKSLEIFNEALLEATSSMKTKVPIPECTSMIINGLVRIAIQKKERKKKQ